MAAAEPSPALGGKKRLKASYIVNLVIKNPARRFKTDVGLLGQYGTLNSPG